MCPIPVLQPEIVQHSLERHSTRVATVVSLSGYKQDTRLVGGDEIFVISCTCNASTSHQFAYNNLAIINSPAKQHNLATRHDRGSLNQDVVCLLSPVQGVAAFTACAVCSGFDLLH
jgi:hypothetical protein